MVTRGFHKRACAVVLVNKVKNPIKLAREMLVRGDRDGLSDDDLSGGAGGAQGHCCLGGKTVEKLAKDWGLEMADESYFWTRKRWDQHKRGLHESDVERAMRQNMDVWPYSADSDTIFVGLAILAAPSSRATVSEICEWLSKKGALRAVPQHMRQVHVSTVLQRGSMSCSYDERDVGIGPHFVLQQRQGNETRGLEPYWTVAPEQMSRFLKVGDDGYAFHNEHQEREGKNHQHFFPEQDIGWDGHSYLPQGTVGCVALDQYGTM